MMHYEERKKKKNAGPAFLYDYLRKKDRGVEGPHELKRRRAEASWLGVASPMRKRMDGSRWLNRRRFQREEKKKKRKVRSGEHKRLFLPTRGEGKERAGGRGDRPYSALTTRLKTRAVEETKRRKPRSRKMF